MDMSTMYSLGDEDTSNENLEKEYDTYLESEDSLVREMVDQMIERERDPDTAAAMEENREELENCLREAHNSEIHELREEWERAEAEWQESLRQNAAMENRKHSLIFVSRQLGLSYAETLAVLQEKFSLSLEDAEIAMRTYW